MSSSRKKILLKVIILGDSGERRAKQWCASKGNIPYFECSAKEATNVKEAFQAVAKVALSQESEADICNDFPDQIRLGDPHNERRNTCGC